MNSKHMTYHQKKSVIDQYVDHYLSKETPLSERDIISNKIIKLESSFYGTNMGPMIISMGLFLGRIFAMQIAQDQKSDPIQAINSLLHSIYLSSGLYDPDSDFEQEDEKPKLN